MTKIKICGLRRSQDIMMANRYKPDFAGFIIDFPKSHRSITPEEATKLGSFLTEEIPIVGVFVDQPIEKVISLLKDGTIDIAQLHGNEPPDYIKQVQDATGCGVIKAFEVKSEADIEEACKSPADYLLLDQGKGGGETFDWSRLAEIKRPYLLAGGLSPDNIAEAVEALHPYGVDVSSGVETDKLKDTEKMRRFVELVRETESSTAVRDEEPCISAAKREDLEEILQLQYLAYQSEAALFKSRDIPPLKETLDEVIEEFEAGTVLKLVEDGKIIGSVRASEKDGTVYIGKLMVHPTRQRRGYGRHLLEEIEKCYPGKRYELFTSTRSIDNISLYQKCGYKIYDNKVINDELEFVYLEKGKVVKI